VSIYVAIDFSTENYGNVIPSKEGTQSKLHEKWISAYAEMTIREKDGAVRED
jgi:hypothetical protein